VKSVQSVKCSECKTLYRTSFRKGGKVPARTCPNCNSDKFEVEVRAKSEDDSDFNF
jgi:hypothetical protein